MTGDATPKPRLGEGGRQSFACALSWFDFHVVPPVTGTHHVAVQNSDAHPLGEGANAFACERDGLS